MCVRYTCSFSSVGVFWLNFFNALESVICIRSVLSCLLFLRDIVRLTAQFVARNGRQFLTTLAAKEQVRPTVSYCPLLLFAAFTICGCLLSFFISSPPPPSFSSSSSPTYTRTYMLTSFLTSLDMYVWVLLFCIPVWRCHTQQYDMLTLPLLSFVLQFNYQFDFLRPQHSLFHYFTKLVEQYTKVRMLGTTP